jgi:hypothetical protein
MKKLKEIVLAMGAVISLAGPAAAQSKLVPDKFVKRLSLAARLPASAPTARLTPAHSIQLAWR